MGAWSHLLTQTLTYKLVTGRTGDGGDLTYGAAQTTKCKVETKARFESGRGGVENAQAGTMVMLDIEIPRQSLCWLPGADTTEDNEAFVPYEVGKAISNASGDTLYYLRFDEVGGRE